MQKDILGTKGESFMPGERYGSTAVQTKIWSCLPSFPFLLLLWGIICLSQKGLHHGLHCLEESSLESCINCELIKKVEKDHF